MCGKPLVNSGPALLVFYFFFFFLPRQRELFLPMASQGVIHQGFKNAKCGEGRKFRQIYRASRHLESDRVLYITRQRKKKGKKNHLRVLLYLKRKQNLPGVSWQFPQEASLALLHHSSTPSAPNCYPAPAPPPTYTTVFSL